jgi:heme exporter protein A
MPISRALINKNREGFGLQQCADKPCEQLSQGQRRKAALCALIAKASPLWLLDEPMAALDDSSIRWFNQSIERHLTAGGIVLMATHHQGDYPREHLRVHLTSC